MTERLADLVLGLQRMAEGARIRGDDLRYTQQQETHDHIAWLDHLLGMVGKVNSVLMEERRKFAPVERLGHNRRDSARRHQGAIARSICGQRNRRPNEDSPTMGGGFRLAER